MLLGVFVLLGMVILLLIWYVQFRWDRRNLYREAAKIHGPAGWPLIGQALGSLTFARDSKGSRIAPHVAIVRTVLKFSYEKLLISTHGTRRILLLNNSILHTEAVSASLLLRAARSRNEAFTAETFLKQVTYLANSYPKMIKMWFGPELVIGVYNPEALEVILNSPNALSRQDLVYGLLVPLIGFGLVTGPVQKWKRHRKTINPSFNQQVLNGFMEIFSEQCIILVDQLRKFADKKEFEISGLLSKCAVDVTCETIMGVKLDEERCDANIQFIIHRLSQIVGQRMRKFWLQSDILFNRTKTADEFRSLTKQFHEFVANVIKKKREIINNRPENISMKETTVVKRKAFLDLLFENSNFTEEELNEEVNTFMIGGSDTISLIAGFTFLMLGMHSDVQDKVLEEALGVVGPDREVRLSDLPDMKYTECVVKETLRLFPAFPYLIRSLDDDILLQDGVTFPKGSSILIDVLDMHRSGNYWPDPLKFNPDRFSPEEGAKRHPYSFLPFSAGPRNCIGYKFGYMLLKTMVASVVRAYKVSTKFKKLEDIELTFEVTLGSTHGFPIFLKTRRSF